MKYAYHILVISFLFFSIGCEKDESPEEIVFDDPEALTIEESESLENLEEGNHLNMENVVLPNGLTISNFLQEMDIDFYNDWLRTTTGSSIGPQDARNLLIAKLGAIAINLSDRSKHQFPYEGPNKPAQNGIAYSWGGKNHTRRQAPPGPRTVCHEEIYGLDCSGFIHQLFTNAGVPFIIGPANSQRQPETIKNSIISAIPELDVLEVEDLGKLETNKIECGDIIYWMNSSGTRASHIGMVFIDSNGEKYVFQSNGTPGKNQEECSKNLGLRRGVRRLAFSEFHWFGGQKEYGVVRMNAKISGKWDFHFRCQGNNLDFFVEELNFPTDYQSSFELTKNFIDTDGSYNTTHFIFNYENTTNVLTCEFITTDGSIPGFERRDNFSIKLERDDIGYFTCENVYIINGTGCTIEARLINKETI